MTKAFTIVEMIVIVVVVGVLSTLAVIISTSVQQESRDATRQGNATIVSEALEKYYEKNGEYPSVASIVNNQPSNTGAVVASRLSVPVDSLIMPTMPATTTNAITSGIEPENDFLAYQAESADDNAACQTDIAGGCDEYILRYLEESTGEIKVLESRRSAREVATRPDLELNPISLTAIDATWTAVIHATSYELQRSLSTDFSSAVTTTHSGISNTNSDLTPNTEYFFRVRAVQPETFSDWSDIRSATTNSLTAPSGTIAIAATMSGTNARGTADGGTCASGATIEYQIRYQINGGSWSAFMTGTPRDVAANEGYSYTFQAQARCKVGADTGPWATSPTASVTRPVTAPTSLTVAATMSGTNARGTAGGGTCASGTTIERQIRYEATSTSTAGTWSTYLTGSPRDVAANQGWRYTFQQQARCVGSYASSGWTTSATASVVRPIAFTPATPSMTNSTSGNTTTYSWNATTGCPVGSTANYQVRATMDSPYDSGYVDWTSGTSIGVNTSSQGYEYVYYARTNCATVHAAGGWSGGGQSSYLRPITAPGAPTNFSLSHAPDRMWWRISYTHPTCGPGTVQHHQFGAWIGSNSSNYGWLPGPYTGWQNQTSPHWNSAGFGEWVAYKQANNQVNPTPTGVQVRLKLQYRCTNTVTNRSSTLGPETFSPIFNT